MQHCSPDESPLWYCSNPHKHTTSGTSLLPPPVPSAVSPHNPPNSVTALLPPTSSPHGTAVAPPSTLQAPQHCYPNKSQIIVLHCPPALERQYSTVRPSIFTAELHSRARQHTRAHLRSTCQASKHARASLSKHFVVSKSSKPACLSSNGLFGNKRVSLKQKK